MIPVNKNILVVGAGNMGGAMARGFAAGGFDVTLYNRSAGRLEPFRGVKGITVTDDLSVAFKKIPAMVLLCTPAAAVPDLCGAMIEQIANTRPIVASCAASCSMDEMDSALSEIANPRIARILPNIGVAVGKGAMLVCQRNLDDKDMEFMHSAVDTLGTYFEVPEEQFPAAMSLSSCGIAYALRYVRAAMQAGVTMGLEADLGERITASVLEGTAALLENCEHPEVLIDRVTTPGGLTVAGLNELDAHGFSYALIAALKAARKQ